jgi:FtsH-binding integral membrane protein
MIYSLSWAALSISLINLIFLRSSFVTMGLAFIFSAIYSVYIIVDTQMIMGGKNKELTLDDYILGSVILYTDIISLFLKLLQILGKKKDD